VIVRACPSRSRRPPAGRARTRRVAPVALATGLLLSPVALATGLLLSPVALATGLLLSPVALAQDLPAVPGLPGSGAKEAPPPSAPIQVQQTRGADRALADRLREIYGQVDGLEGVRVEVASGVVRLSGEVLSGAAADKAVRIARQLQGVVEVESEVVEVQDLQRRLVPTLAALRERLEGLLARLPLLAVAIAVLALFVVLGRVATVWEAPYRRLVQNHFARDWLRQGVRAGFALAGALLALELLDATTIVAAVAGAAGLAGLALGFAFRDLAENAIASVLLSLRQPFLPDDHVVIEGFEGQVVRLNSRATILMDLEGNHVRIPNATVFKGILVNYTRNPRRRFDFTVSVGGGTDLAAALALGLDVLRDTPGVLPEPPPQAWIDELGDWAVLLHFFGWVDQREAEWAKVRSVAIRGTKEAFDAAGIELPDPTLAVRALPAAAERGPTGGPPATPGDTPVDVSPDTHLEREIASDRAAVATETDLLDPDAPRE